MNEQWTIPRCEAFKWEINTIRCVNHSAAGKIVPVAISLFRRVPLCSECAYIEDAMGQLLRELAAR